MIDIKKIFHKKPKVDNCFLDGTGIRLPNKVSTAKMAIDVLLKTQEGQQFLLAMAMLMNTVDQFVLHPGGCKHYDAAVASLGTLLRAMMDMHYGTHDAEEANLYRLGRREGRKT